MKKEDSNVFVYEIKNIYKIYIISYLFKNLYLLQKINKNDFILQQCFTNSNISEIIEDILI